VETPALRLLMGAYFHQDWYHDGSEEEVVELFVQQNARLVPRLVEDVDAILAASRNEAETEAAVVALGPDYDPASRYGGYRAWLQEIGRRARAHHESA